jgi:dihydrofolate reductase
MNINIIVAVEMGSRGIGYQNKIPWYFPEDLKNFSKVTKGNSNNAIIMGRKTWESLPKKPLPKRQNIILSRSIEDINLYDNELYFNSMTRAIDHCKQQQYDEVWIIGGSEIYKVALETLPIDNIYITEIYKEYDCDSFFPETPESFTCVKEREEINNEIILRYKIFKNHKEGCP